MAKPKASAVCATSIACAQKQPPIVYAWGKESATEQDCQGHIEFCVRQNGGVMSYAGSNDMFRNACSWVGTIAEAKANGYYIPGALLFQVKSGGDYPEKYHADGKGNAQHIGYLIAMQSVELVHASSKCNVVKTDTMSSSWNYLGLAKAIDYSEYIDSSSDSPTPTNSITQEDVVDAVTGVVTATGEGLRMRETPGGPYMLLIPNSAQITIYDTASHEGELWGKTSWAKDCRTYSGWVMMNFVELHREEDVETKTLIIAIPVADEDAAQKIMSVYIGSYLMEVQS